MAGPLQRDTEVDSTGHADDWQTSVFYFTRTGSNYYPYWAAAEMPGSKNYPSGSRRVRKTPKIPNDLPGKKSTERVRVEK